MLAPHMPFSPRRWPFFYGWIVVGAATFGILASIPGQTMGVSAFTDSLLEATGLSRVGFSTAYLIGTLASAAMLQRAGSAIDRYGARAGAMAAALGLGGVVILLSQVDRLAALLSPGADAPWWLTFGVITVLFAGIRFTGQGSLTLASRTMLARWFDRRRGLATAVSGLVVSFGFAIAPRVLDAWLVAAGGWRSAYLQIGLVEMVGVVLLVWVLFRETPEASGLLPDGRPADELDDDRPAEATTTRTEALRTRAFWVLTLALALHGMVITGVTLHIVDLGRESGLDRVGAVSVFVPFAIVSTSTGALVGWLADRVQIRVLVLTFLLAAALGYASSAHLGHPVGYALTAVGFGVAGGHFSVLTTVALPRFFGRRHLATINGASMTAIVVGSALGPSVLAVSRSWLGSYAPALYLCALLPLLVAVPTLWPLHPRDVPG